MARGCRGVKAGKGGTGALVSRPATSAARLLVPGGRLGDLRDPSGPGLRASRERDPGEHHLAGGRRERREVRRRRWPPLERDGKVVGDLESLDASRGASTIRSPWRARSPRGRPGASARRGSAARPAPCWWPPRRCAACAARSTACRARRRRRRPCCRPSRSRAPPRRPPRSPSPTRPDPLPGVTSQTPRGGRVVRLEPGAPGGAVVGVDLRRVVEGGHAGSLRAAAGSHTAGRGHKTISRRSGRRTAVAGGCRSRRRPGGRPRRGRRRPRPAVPPRRERRPRPAHRMRPRRASLSPRTPRTPRRPVLAARRRRARTRRAASAPRIAARSASVAERPADDLLVELGQLAADRARRARRRRPRPGRASVAGTRPGAS